MNGGTEDETTVASNAHRKRIVARVIIVQVTFLLGGVIVIATVNISLLGGFLGTGIGSDSFRCSVLFIFAVAGLDGGQGMIATAVGGRRRFLGVVVVFLGNLVRFGVALLVNAIVKFGKGERTMSVVFVGPEKMRQHLDTASVQENTSAEAEEHAASHSVSLVFDSETDGDTDGDADGEEALESKRFPEGERGRDAE